MQRLLLLGVIACSFPHGTLGGAVDTMSDIDMKVDIGCSDGTREAFVDLVGFPRIAACAGGWSVRGVFTGSAGCVSGNDSANSIGLGCAIADLCAPGWQVCATPADVMLATNGAGCAAVTEPLVFFTTQVSGSGNAKCDLAGTNDFFGCGTMGLTAVASDCAPLVRFTQTTGMSSSCVQLTAGGWDCASDPFGEATNVTKGLASGGGALCCRI